MKNLGQLMKQAQEMQERMQKEMAALRVEGSSGGGMVTVVLDGDARERPPQLVAGAPVRRRPPAVQQPGEAVAYAQHLHAVFEPLPHHGPNGGVHAGGIAAAG